MGDFDMREFRDALGAFATGVTVVTTRTTEGVPVGLTVTSFNSVSLDPPLILWSLQRDSNLFEAFEAAERFAVHVLSEAQVDVSQQFAQRDVDRFEGVAMHEDSNGLPLLDGCAAVFVCSKHAEYDGGDHVILLGRVESFEHHQVPALAFYRSGYAALTRDVHDPDL